MEFSRWLVRVFARPRRRCTGERVPTQIFNGYGEFVADLYADIDDKRLFM